MAMQAAAASLIYLWPSPAEFTGTSESHSDAELGLGLKWKRGELLFLSLISAAFL